MLQYFKVFTLVLGIFVFSPIKEKKKSKSESDFRNFWCYNFVLMFCHILIMIFKVFDNFTLFLL